MSDISKICPGLAATTTRLQEEVLKLEKELNGIKPSFFAMDSTEVQTQISQLKKKIKLKLNVLDQLNKAAKGAGEVQKMFSRTV